MTLRDTCAVAYVSLVDQLEREIDLRITGALFARSMGAEVEIPDRAEARSRFEQLLCAEPLGVESGSMPSTRRELLREAFGLSPGR